MTNNVFWERDSKRSYFIILKGIVCVFRFQWLAGRDLGTLFHHYLPSTAVVTSAGTLHINIVFHHLFKYTTDASTFTENEETR